MFYYERDTIAAVSTAMGSGGIGIIRISGDNAVEIADSIFQGKNTVCAMADHTIAYGKIVDVLNDDIIDEVMITKLLAPATYTREDVIEINCHGNMVSQRKILDLIYKYGARPAHPGEFTKRAFLNGRIDLTQAEAVIDLINSKTEMGHKAAVEQLSGRISKYLNNIIDRLLTILARIEVTVDYPEHDDEIAESVIARDEIMSIILKLEQVLESYNTGRLIKAGIKTAIVGKPNVGKSTLLNELSGYQRAIVTDIPGTTRDIIEEDITIDGILLKLIDTAGIRNTDDVVERIGVERARDSLKNADLIIYVISLSEKEPVDKELMWEIKGRKAIIVLNKEDLVSKDMIDEVRTNIIEYMKEDISNIKIVKTALTCEKGLEYIKDTISELFISGKIVANDEPIITAQRHALLIEQAMRSLKDGIYSLESQMPLDMISVDIRNAADCLGEITGISIKEDLTDRIFSSFCLGK